MNKNEIKKWFWNHFNSCVWLENSEHKGEYYLIVDKNLLRQKKLNRLIGTNKIKSSIDLKDSEYLQENLLFYLNLKKKLFWCDYTKIWSVFYSNNFVDYDSVKDFIKDMLLEHDKLIFLTSHFRLGASVLELLEHDKLAVLTPTAGFLATTFSLLEHELEISGC